MAFKEMYTGLVNSIATTITNSISDTDTVLFVQDDTRIPEAPNLLVLGTDASAETVKLVEKDGSQLTVERGFQGFPRAWNAGSPIARNFTEYDHKAFKENIEELAENQEEFDSHLAQKANKFKGTLLSSTTAQSIANNTNTIISFNSVVYDDVSAYSGTTPTRITIPLGVTKIKISAQVSWGQNSSGERRMEILKNGTEYVGFSTNRLLATSLNDFNTSFSPILNVSQGDYFEVRVYQSSGSAQDVGPTIATQKAVWFAMEVVE